LSALRHSSWNAAHAVAPYAFLFPDRLNRSDFSVLNDWRDRLMARPAAVYVAPKIPTRCRGAGGEVDCGDCGV
jgi:hypothetical protein